MMSIEIKFSFDFSFDANGVLPDYHDQFEQLVTAGSRKGVIVWDTEAIPAEMIEAAWEAILGADWDNLTPADVEDAVIAALTVRLP